jgi:hypothetical protein
MISESTITTILTTLKNTAIISTEHFSSTRDIFTARMQSYILESKKYLEAAVIGEIGNNTFDHNFVYPRGSPRGVYCNLLYNQQYVVIADFGRGIKQSLLCVLPEIKTDVEAMEIAFTKRISGRSPEQRGNGLKFVSNTIQQNNWEAYFQSGTGCCIINKRDMQFFINTTQYSGCLAIINFNEVN